MAEFLLPRILLVDDDKEVLDALRRLLRGYYDVAATHDPKEAIRLAVSHGPFAVVVSDLRMPGMDGISLLFLIRKAAPETVRVLLGEWRLGHGHCRHQPGQRLPLPC